MGDWRCIELLHEQISAGELEKIRAQFSLFCMTRDSAADIALFTRRKKSGGSEVYFSPAAVPYAEFVFEHHTPRACRSPALLGTTLLVGSPASVAALLGKSFDAQSLRKNSAPSPGGAMAIPRKKIPETPD